MAALSIPAGTATAADKDCSDFRTWRQAQNFYSCLFEFRLSRG